MTPKHWIARLTKDVDRYQSSIEAILNFAGYAKDDLMQEYYLQQAFQAISGMRRRENMLHQYQSWLENAHD